MTPETRKHLIEQHERILHTLKTGCTHQFRPLKEKELNDPWMSVGATCTVCKKSFGWRCKKSPDQCCHYFTENGKVTLNNGTEVDPPPEHDVEYETYDGCIFCGHPSERK